MELIDMINYYTQLSSCHSVREGGNMQGGNEE